MFILTYPRNIHDSLIFHLVKCGFIPSGIFILFLFKIRLIFNGFIEKLNSEISSFLTGMAFPHKRMWKCPIHILGFYAYMNQNVPAQVIKEAVKTNTLYA